MRTYFREKVACLAVGTLLSALSAAAQERGPRLPDVAEMRIVRRSPSGPLGTPIARAPADELPLPHEPGKILGLDIRPDGPSQVETLPGTTAPVGELALADLEGMALANNPTLAQANAQIEAARGRWLQAGLLPNPNLGYAGNEIGNAGTAGQQGAYIGQTVPLGGKLRLSRAVADQEIRQALWQRESQQWMVLNDVRIAFFDALVAQRAVALTAQLLEISGQGEQTASDLLRIQQVSRVDYLQARIEARAARIEANNARNRLDAAWRHLTAVVGLPYLPCAKLLGDPAAGIVSLDWCESLSRVLGSSPELAAAQAGVSRAQFAVQRARVQRVPDFDAQYSPQYDTSARNNIHNVQATLNIPLFNRNQGNIRAAQAELTAAMRDVNRIELDLQSRLAEAFERYANARQQTDAYTKDILPDAQTSLDLVRDGYRQGEFGYLTLLTAQRTYFQTSLSYLRALQALRESIVEIEGYLLTGSLGSPASGGGAILESNSPTTSPMERIGQ